MYDGRSCARDFVPSNIRHHARPTDKCEDNDVYLARVSPNQCDDASTEDSAGPSRRNRPHLQRIRTRRRYCGCSTGSPVAPDDWSTVNCGGGNALAKTGVLHDGLAKSIYTGGGSKDPELLSSWKHKDGSVPDKDEIINAYAAKYFGSPGGDTILIFGADRYDNSGTAFIGFWFFKSPVFAAADGRFREGRLATDTLSTHAIGDVLVLVEFTQGGAVATAKVFEWVGSGGSESGGTLNDITGTGQAWERILYFEQFATNN